MEAASEGESNKINGISSSDGPKKPRRQMKTPFQLDTLEKTYALHMYPSEATRQELSEKLGLTDRQLQMWFCHRRLKDKKDGVQKKLQASDQVAPEEVAVQESDHGPGSRSRSRSVSCPGSGQGSDSSQFDHDCDLPMVTRIYEPSPRSAMQRVIACVEAQLGEPLREDGPILGMEFDEPPPGAFGEPIVAMKHQERSVHSRDSKLADRSDSMPIKASVRNYHGPVGSSIRTHSYGQTSSHFFDSPINEQNTKPLLIMQENVQLNRGYGVHGHESSVSLSSQHVKQERLLSPSMDDYVPTNEDALQIGRKRKIDETRSGKDVQANGKKVQKELEKQDLLRRKKREEQIRREMEKQDRDRRKEEERMMREKQKMEEKFQREEKCEIERREKFLQREFLKAEKKRQKDEQRRERDALKQKAAIEKATARKFAKEYMELIEDERLELMKLATSSKGLPSILSLDHETLQNLDLFRGSLCAFPPRSVQLKKPFTVQPWIDSEDKVGKLFMVWRFCITFADVLGLWPFTLDEFIQAFHDYDSRLLSEIHITLLKLIIKDIEDVARTPSRGLGTNQYTAANPEGGHPRIVEGAYLWGFDIRNWQNHLNAMTWPEILRQFALSAGLGPKLKKESTDQTLLNDTSEGKGCEDTISMLRNGSAAENAVAIMQEKGYSSQRRTRHRLTPGTVKFAAYHVLALEGGKGLNVIELADKIQKSGLRDLTTSKTPDASISVALSRDPILFERIAPSTYCVRPAFRKDPENAEAVLSAAREKIQRYVNGFLGGGNADDVEEKDDDSECDVAEVPEVDDLCTPSSPNQNIVDRVNDDTRSRDAKDSSCKDVALILKHAIDTEMTGDPLDQFIDDKSIGGGARKLEQGGTEIDESKSGEPWVQGLTEGEYSDLCVEERLGALVSLIEVANEGNIIRAVLEDRLDAANALKKQMWAEAQLDKKRMKEETVKNQDSSLAATGEGSQSVLSNYDAPLKVKEERPSFTGLENAQNQISSQNGNNTINNSTTVERSRMQLKSFIGHRAEEMYVYRSLPLGQDRRRNRYWQFVACPSRHDPGSGRIFVEFPNGYWRLIDSVEAFDSLLKSLETRGVRESHLHTMLTVIEASFKENVRRNSCGSNTLNQSGAATKTEVAELGSSASSNMDSDSPTSAVCGSNPDTIELSSSFRIELGQNETERNNALKRYQDLHTWMWKECVNPSRLRAVTYAKKGCKPVLGICSSCFDCYIFEENTCPACCRVFGTFDSNLNYSEYVIQCEERSTVNPIELSMLGSSHPLRVRFLKALLTILEVSVPSDALQPSWVETHRNPWGLKLQRALSAGDLLQILTQFESFIKRDSLSTDYETTDELLRSCASSRKEFFQSSSMASVPQLPWIPQTTAAITLRLLELDSSIAYALLHKDEPHNHKYIEDFTKGHLTKVDQYLDMKEEKWASLGRVRGVSSSRQAARGRGGSRLRGRAIKTSKSSKRNVRDSETLTQFLVHQGQRSTGRGLRTNRRRRIEKAAAMDTLEDHLGFQGTASGGELPMGGEAWGVEEGEETGKIKVEDGDYSVEESESDDNAPVNRYEDGERWDHQGYGNDSNRVATWDLMEMSDDDVEGSEDDNGYENEKLDGGDIDMNDQLEQNEDDDLDLDVRDENLNYGLDRNEDEGLDSADSDDYSD